MSIVLSFFVTEKAVIVWQLDLQLPLQSVPISTKVLSLNHVHGEVYSIQSYVIKCFRDFFSPVSSTNQTDLHDSLNIAKSGVKYHKAKQQQIRLCCNNTYNEMDKQIFSFALFFICFFNSRDQWEIFVILHLLGYL